MAHSVSDPDDKTQYFSVKNDGLAMSKKSKVKLVTDIHKHIFFLVSSSIGLPKYATALYKYVHAQNSLSDDQIIQSRMA